MPSAIGERLRDRLRRPVGTLNRQRGIALVVVAVTVAVLGAVVGDFSYNARVDLEAAANARDQLRAEYLARSGIALSRLLIKVQQSVIDPARKFLGDIQITEFSPYLIKAFGGEADERAGLGALLGIDASSLKGLGAGKGATFDVAMSTEDGKLNVNCGGGFGDPNHQQQVYALLGAMFMPPRYNRIFERADADGQFFTRDDVARAIIDWADIDENRFTPPAPGATGPSSGGSGSEDYRYDAGRDPYRAHNHFYDTVDELNLVRGVHDDLWGSFGEMMTVYGSCKLNIAAIKPEHWPLIAAVIRGTLAKGEETKPAALDDLVTAQLAQRVIAAAQMFGGLQSTDQFIKLVSDPASLLNLGGNDPNKSTPPPPPPDPNTTLKLDPAKVNNVVMADKRKVYRLDAVGTVQRTREKGVQVHIRAIWDTTHFNQNTTSADPNDRQGTWVYWRED
jgi:general secretion pathway protein K